MSTTESDGEGVENMRGLLPSWVGPSERPAVLEVSKGGKVMTSLSLDTAPIVSLGRSAEKVSQCKPPAPARIGAQPTLARPKGGSVRKPRILWRHRAAAHALSCDFDVLPSSPPCDIELFRVPVIILGPALPPAGARCALAAAAVHPWHVSLFPSNNGPTAPPYAAPRVSITRCLL